MIKPSDFLQLADTLAQTPDEVYLRESIVAAYYAVFHECRLLAERLANHAGMGARSGSHVEVISKLSRYPANNAEQLPQAVVLRIRSLGYLLKECRDQRSVASYQLDDTISQDIQQRHADNVTKLLSTLSQLRAAHPELAD